MKVEPVAQSVNQSRLAIARSRIDLSRESRKNLNRSRTRCQLTNKVTNRCTTYCFLTVMIDPSGAMRSEFKESPAFLTLPSLSLSLFFLSSFPYPETSRKQVVSRNPVALRVSRTAVHDITRIPAWLLGLCCRRYVTTRMNVATEGRVKVCHRRGTASAVTFKEPAKRLVDSPVSRVTTTAALRVARVSNTDSGQHERQQRSYRTVAIRSGVSQPIHQVARSRYAW